MPRGWRGCRRCGSRRLASRCRRRCTSRRRRRAGVDDIEPLHRLAERTVRVAEEHDVRPGEVGRVEQRVERILHAVAVAVRAEKLHAVERALQHLGIDRARGRSCRTRGRAADRETPFPAAACRARSRRGGTRRPAAADGRRAPCRASGRENRKKQAPSWQVTSV